MEGVFQKKYFLFLQNPTFSKHFSAFSKKSVFSVLFSVETVCIVLQKNQKRFLEKSAQKIDFFCRNCYNTL